MGKEHIGKSFRSGNSVAIRIPAVLGVEPDQEFVVVRHANGDMTMIPKQGVLDNFMALYGAMSPGFFRDGRRDIEQAERDWNKSPGQATAA
jgi:antitoxin VapB